MAELIRTEPLPEGGELRFYDNGVVRAVDIDGKFRKHPRNHVPSDVARDTRAIGHAEKREDAAEALIVSAGLDPNEVDEGLLALAKIATGGRGSASVSALRYFDQISGLRTGNVQQDGRVHLEPGQPCPACGREWAFSLDRADPDALRSIADMVLELAELAERKEAQGERERASAHG